MSNDTLIYHPPRKEPTVLNLSFFIGMASGIFMGFGDLTASLAISALNASIFGGMEYLQTVKQQRDGIKVSSKRSIFNGGMVLGALATGLLAGAIAMTVPIAATTATISIATFVGSVVGGIGLGALTDKIEGDRYNLALKQQAEKALQIEVQHSKEPEQGKGLYKNIPDLKQEPQISTKYQETELARSKNSQIQI